MESTGEYRQQLVLAYKKELLPLLAYLPWLEANTGKAASSIYGADGLSEHSVSFPVYDATLLRFVREATQTSFMDRNYSYVYTRNHLRTHEDERRLIRSAGIEEWSLLCGILSKYVLGGRTKGTLWSEGVQEEIFYLLLVQMKHIVEYWDRPIEGMKR